MIVLEKEPELSVGCAQKAELRVERTDIAFEDIGENRVRVRVTVRNGGGTRSMSARLRLESAPLGAFVPWRPLTSLLVPPLEPGESRELSADVARPVPVPLGDFDRVPPQRLLTAISSPDQPAPRSNSAAGAWLNLFVRRHSDSASSRDGGSALLAPDLWDLVGRGQVHWAGNINVFVGRRPVERHLARGLRVYPGRTNLTMFVVGSRGKPDAYAFHLTGLPDWKAALFNNSNRQSLEIGPSDVPIGEAQWVDSDGGSMMLVAVRPPGHCHSGTLEVHVTQRSDGRTAIVEFDLDPRAQGPGCYSV